jgi:hypothetical protein
MRARARRYEWTREKNQEEMAETSQFSETWKKKVVNPEFYIQQKYPQEWKYKDLFRFKKTKVIYFYHTCTKRSIKASSLGRREMIPEERIKMALPEGNHEFSFEYVEFKCLQRG